MKLATGTVVGAKIVVEGEPLPEGMVVTVLAREDEETFDIPPELEQDLVDRWRRRTAAKHCPLARH